MPTYARRILITALALVLLLCALPLALLGLGATDAGTTWLAGLAKGRLAGQVSWEELRGTLLGRLELTGVEVAQPGVQFSARSVRVLWRPRALFQGELAVDALTVEDAELTLLDSGAEEATEPFQPATLRPPLDVILRDATLRNLRLKQTGQPTQIIELAALDATLQREQLTLHRLEIRHADGSLTASGAAALADLMPLDIAVEANWRLPTADGAPTDALLGATLALSGEIDWRDRMVANIEYHLDLRGIDALVPDLPPQIAGRGRVAAALDGARLELQDLTLAIDNTPLALSMTGLASQTDTDTPRLQARLEWVGVRWPVMLEQPQFRSDRGHLEFSGTLDAYSLTLQSTLNGAELPASEWRAVANGDAQQLHIEQLDGELLEGNLAVRGDVSWSPVPAWDLQLEGHAIEPSPLVPELTGTLDTLLDTTGRIDPERGPAGTVSLRSLSARALDMPIAMQGEASFTSSTLSLATLQLSSGANHLAASGELSPGSLALDWDILLVEPGQVLPGATGRLEGTGRVGGSPEAPELVGELSGTTLALDALTVGTLSISLEAGLTDGSPLDLRLEADDISDAGNTLLHTLAVNARGTTAAHAINLTADAPTARINAALQGGLSTATMLWSGDLTELSGEAEPVGSWELSSAAPLTLSAESVRLDPSCLRGIAHGETLCIDGTWEASGASAFAVDLEALPVEALSPTVSGTLSGGVSGTLAADGQIFAEGQFLLGPGQLQLPEGLKRPALDHGGGNLALTVGEDGLLVRLNIAAPEDGTLSARLTLPALHTFPLASEQPLEGTLQATLPDLAIAAALVDGIASSAGHLSADLQLAGTLERPEIAGELTLGDGAVSLPVAGLALNQITLHAAGDPDRPGMLTLSGGLQSGPGRVDLDGSVNLTAGNAQVALRGERLQVFNTADARALLSPDLQVNWSDDTLYLRGLLTVPQASITPKLRLSAATAGDPAAGKLPGAVILPSPDVVILGEDPAAASSASDPEAPFRIDAALDLLLGDDVRVSAVGLISRIAGGLNITLDPEQRELIPHARGVISLEDGTFRSFGQDLDIETGQLIFADVPVTEPELYLRAVRWIDNDPNVTAAGVLVTGAATTPQLELFSRPQLETTAIQSYLLTGTAQGGGNSVLSFGTYLTERVYVGYGYNLLEETSEFDALFTVTPRYGLGADVGEADSNFNLTFTHEH